MAPLFICSSCSSPHSHTWDSIASPMQDVVVAFDISRRTFRRILLNFVWAYGYNVVSAWGGDASR